MTEQPAGPRAQATPDEQERAAEAESYGGAPIDDQELADVWTDGGQAESARVAGAGAEGASPGDAAGEPTD